jgi:hypothetical protein
VLAAAHLQTGEWIGLAGIVATVLVGVGIAWWQAIKAGSKADAAKAAADAAQRQLAGMTLLARTNDLEQLERRLRTAAGRAERHPSREAVLDWRRAAEEYSATLQAASIKDEPLDTHLALALGVVEIALGDLADTEISPERACRVLLQHAGRACGASRRVATAMMFAPAGGNST